MKKLFSLGVMLAALVLASCGKPVEQSKAVSEKSEESQEVQKTSEQKSSEQKSSSSSSSSSKVKSSSLPPTPTPDATQSPVTQTTTPDEDGKGETITWSAQDANKDSDGFNSSGKFSSTGSYAKFTFTATMAMRARLFVTIDNRSDAVWDRETQTGNQSIWYNWYDGDDWKYIVNVNTIKINQAEMGTYNVNGVDIPMKELVYTDFLQDGQSTLEAPWFEFDVLEGRNTIRIERNLGYSVNMKSFKVVGKQVSATPAP